MMTRSAAGSKIWTWSKESNLTNVNDIADLVQILQDRPEWRNTVRGLIVGEELANLPQALATFIDATNDNFSLVHQRLERLETDVAELKTGVAELKTGVAELKTGVAELKTGVAELKTGVAELKTDMNHRFNQVNGRLDNGFGENYESKIAKNIMSIARQQLEFRRIQVLATRAAGITTELQMTIEDAEDTNLITKDEADQLILADLILIGEHPHAGPNTYMLAELSITIGEDDIRRASDRARILRTATGRSARPTVIGARIDPDRSELAKNEGVFVTLIPE